MPKRSNTEEPRLRRRRQPPRGCKRIRFHFHSNLRLLDLPEDMIRVILQFSRPKEGLNEPGCWLWASQVGKVCHVFHEIVSDLAPTALNILPTLGSLPSNQWAPFLQSIVNMPCKQEKLTKVYFTCATIFELDVAQPVMNNQDARTAVRALLAAPGVLPKVEEIFLWTPGYGGDFTGFFDMSLLLDMAHNRPRLSNLKLARVPLQPTVSVDEMESFGNSLPSLRDLRLVLWESFSDNALEALLRGCGRDLTSLDIENVMNDHRLAIVTRHCLSLRELSLCFSEVSSEGLGTYLRSRGALLERLNIDLNARTMGHEVVDMLALHAPQLKDLQVENCPWFNDDCLNRLVQAQVNRAREQGDGTIRLSKVFAAATGVTEVGAHRILRTNGIGAMKVVGGSWVVQN